jgi:hypothetical protein
MPRRIYRHRAGPRLPGASTKSSSIRRISRLYGDLNRGLPHGRSIPATRDLLRRSRAYPPISRAYARSNPATTPLGAFGRRSPSWLPSRAREKLGGAMPSDLREPPGRCSGCWPHAGEVDGCAVEIFVRFSESGWGRRWSSGAAAASSSRSPRLPAALDSNQLRGHRQQIGKSAALTVGPPLWGPMTANGEKANFGANPVDFGGNLAPGTFRPLKSRREIDHCGGRLLRSLTDFRRQRKLGTTELGSGTSASLRTGFSRVRCRAQCRGSQRTIELQTRLR